MTRSVFLIGVGIVSAAIIVVRIAVMEKLEELKKQFGEVVVRKRRLDHTFMSGR
jgi:hypothetical protein